MGTPETAGKAAPDANETSKSNPGAPREPPGPWMCPRGRILTSTPSLHNALDLPHMIEQRCRKPRRDCCRAKTSHRLMLSSGLAFLPWVGVLNIFLEPLKLSLTWRESSMVVATAQGGMEWACARSIWTWVLDFVWEGRLPFHSYGYTRQTVLEDEDLLKEIQEELSENRRQASSKHKTFATLVAGEKIQNLFSCGWGSSQTWHLTVDGTKMACKTEVAATAKRSNGDVY